METPVIKNKDFRQETPGTEPIPARRRRQVGRWVVIWRLMTLVALLMLVCFSPQKLGAPQQFAVLMTVVALYVGIHYFLFETLPTAKMNVLHYADLLTCSAYVLAAGTAKVAFFMIVFACSSFLTIPVTRVGKRLVEALLLGIVYFVANGRAGLSPIDVLGGQDELGALVIIFVFSLGTAGLYAVLERLSYFELETLLEKQRKSYRRKLHDDLGNILCGLHFRIEMLEEFSGEALHETIGCLAKGYQRAVEVLDNILGGIEELEVENIDDALLQAKQRLEQDTGVEIEISGSAAGLDLGPELAREIVAIVSEALLNACKHSGAEMVHVEINRKLRCLRIAVIDHGGGFDGQHLRQRQEAGHVGIRSMYERASLAGANLLIDSVRGRGTRVELEVRAPLRSRFGWSLLPETRQAERLFSLLVFLKIPLLLLISVQAALTVGDFYPIGMVIVLCLALDCVFWLLFRPLLFQWLTRYPSLIIFNFAYYLVVFYLGQGLGYGLHEFHVTYTEAAMMLSGLILGFRGNMVLAAGFVAGILASFWIAAPDPALVSTNQLLEDLSVFSVAVLAIGLSAGLAGDFVRRLEREQRREVQRTLARERDKLTLETHQQLGDLITGLGNRLADMERRVVAGISIGTETEKVQMLSRTLKARLRAIIITMETTATESGSTLQEERNLPPRAASCPRETTAPSFDTF